MIKRLKRFFEKPVGYVAVYRIENWGDIQRAIVNSENMGLLEKAWISDAMCTFSGINGNRRTIKTDTIQSLEGFPFYSMDELHQFVEDNGGPEGFFGYSPKEYSR